MEGAFKDLTGYLWGGGGGGGEGAGGGGGGGGGGPKRLAHYEGGIGCRQQPCCLVLCANAVYGHGTLLPDL